MRLPDIRRQLGADLGKIPSANCHEIALDLLRRYDEKRVEMNRLRSYNASLLHRKTHLENENVNLKLALASIAPSSPTKSTLARLITLVATQEYARAGGEEAT